MEVFDAARGSHVEIKAGSTMISLEPALTSSNIIVSDVNISLAERATVISCFNKFNYIFAFGHNPEISQISITFTGFLVDSDQCNEVKTGKVIGEIVDYYSGKRISEHKQLIKMTAGTKTIEGALVGLTLDGLSPELNMITATLTMLAVSSPSNKQGG